MSRSTRASPAALLAGKPLPPVCWVIEQRTSLLRTLCVTHSMADEGACTTRKSNRSGGDACVRFDPNVMEALVPGPLTLEQANELRCGSKKAVFERALGAELAHQLGYDKDQPRGRS